MVTRVSAQRAIIDRVAVWGCLTGFLGVVQFIGSTDDWPRYLLIGAGFVVALLILADALNLAGLKWGRWRQAAGLIVAIVLASGLYLFGRSTLAVWVLVGALFALVAWLDQFATATFRSRIWRGVARLALAGVGGFVPTVLNQIETRFSDEEFFVFVQGVALAGFCFLFLTGVSYVSRSQKESLWPTGRPTRLQSWLVAIAAAGVTLGLGFWGVVDYQGSFYTQIAPGYPGITETSPFVCGQVLPDPQQPSGEEVYRQLLGRVEANPRKGTPELGMLALGTGERRWAESFRDAILAEAQAGRFTGPANSVKSGQYEAALRVYYAPRVRAAFPDLFAEEDWSILRAWFAAINRRALTVEWVDWMYALAFSKWPEGPYENQENGAGLLAILEVEGLSSPDLASRNRAYLERNRRGWIQRFRNTDDALIYQPEWLTNAYFQSLYWQAQNGLGLDTLHRRLSFEWLLLQAQPGGEPLEYNHPGRFLPAGIAYLSARLENDPRFVWWSSQVVKWAEENQAVLPAQPGVENALDLEGDSPTAGSCLLYGDSGLPNQVGPLAPDKVVFRDGWSSDASYLLLNLRFSGWHRYKATNGVASLYQAGPVVVEKSSGKPFSWLPVGRSLFRDKRIPRENLNGLLIPSSGLSQVTHSLVGAGSQWAQDPPAYARVESVNWLGPLDVSRTVMDDWQAWQQTRTVYFVHEGPVLVVDTAQGNGQAAIAWHLVGEGRRDEERLWVRITPVPVQMALSPRAWQNTSIQSSETISKSGNIGVPNWDVVYHSPTPGRLSLASAFFSGAWASAQYETQDLAGGQYITLTGQDKSLTLLQNDSGQWLQAQDLATDGQWVLAMRQNQSQLLCFSGGMRAQINLGSKPEEIRDTAGHTWTGWDWDEGKLTLHPMDANAAVCLNVVE